MGQYYKIIFLAEDGKYMRAFVEPWAYNSEQHRWFVWWQTQHKKDDLADTLCMCLDAC